MGILEIREPSKPVSWRIFSVYLRLANRNSLWSTSYFKAQKIFQRTKVFEFQLPMKKIFKIRCSLQMIASNYNVIDINNQNEKGLILPFDEHTIISWGLCKTHGNNSGWKFREPLSRSCLSPYNDLLNSHTWWLLLQEEKPGGSFMYISSSKFSCKKALFTSSWHRCHCLIAPIASNERMVTMLATGEKVSL